MLYWIRLATTVTSQVISMYALKWYAICDANILVCSSVCELDICGLWLAAILYEVF